MSKKTTKKSLAYRVWMAFIFCAWVVAVFMAIQMLVALLVGFMVEAGLGWLLGNPVIAQTVLSAVVYVLTIVAVIYIPKKLFKDKTGLKGLGLERRLPTWLDLGLAPMAYVASITTIGLLMYTVKYLIPGFNIEQKQQIGLDPTMVSSQFELMLVYFTLAVLAPIAEELLVRGYLFDKIRRYFSALVTVIITAVIFSGLHLGIGMLNDLQWNVALATFVLGIALGWLRAGTGCVWAGIILHMIQNTVAFLILFALPYSVGV